MNHRSALPVLVFRRDMAVMGLKIMGRNHKQVNEGGKMIPDKSRYCTEPVTDWTSSEAAENWNRNQARRNEMYAAATEMMLDLAEIKVGDRVLDIAAGNGGQTLLAAERVGPDGYVLATDISANMLHACADAAHRAGLSNVETRVMDAENIDLEPDSFDAVICRTALMFFSDPSRAIRGICTAMKPGAKMSAMVFSTAERNPYQGIPLSIAQRFGSKVPSIFGLGEVRVLEDIFRKGGLVDITVHPASIRRHFSSLAALIESLRSVIFLREPMADLSESNRERAWLEIAEQMDRFASQSGVDLPGEMLVAVGSKNI